MLDSASPIFSPCHCAVLRKAARRVSQAYDAAMQPSGLKTSQYSLLAAIHRRSADPPTMQELAEIMVMDRSTLGHNLRPLERGRLVRLEPDPEDRRSKRILLTAHGRAKLEEARELWKVMQRRFERAFGLKRTASLRKALLALAAMEFPGADAPVPERAVRRAERL